MSLNSFKNGINGKHPKRIVIDYYDDLISQVDIYAEDCLKKISDDDYLIEAQDDNFQDLEDSTNSYYQRIEKQFEDPYSDEYKFNEEQQPLSRCNDKVLVKDFVHSQRMKAINEIKRMQKERLEELKTMKNKPNSTEEALFSHKFCFIVNLDEKKFLVKVKFKLLTLVVDFYLENKAILKIENLINDEDKQDDYVIEILDEKSLQIHLLAKYVRCKLESSKPNNDGIYRVGKTQLYAIEKLNLLKSPQFPILRDLKKIKFDDSFDLTCLKSLHTIGFSVSDLNLSGLKNLNCLHLDHFSIDLGQTNALNNLSKLRRLEISTRQIENPSEEFFTYLPNLEVLSISSDSNALPVRILAGLTNLRYFSVRDFKFKLDSLNSLRTLTNLVVLKLKIEIIEINENAFNDFQKLEVLEIHYKKGNWLKRLTNLRELRLIDYNAEIDDIPCILQDIQCLVKLEKLEIRSDQTIERLGENSFKHLKQLKSLCLGIRMEKIESSAFYGLDKLIELKINGMYNWEDCERAMPLDVNSFNCLVNLRKFCLQRSKIELTSENFFDCFPNLLELELERLHGLTLSERTFRNLKKLKKLSIVACRLETFPENAFLSASQLISLSLRGNSLLRRNGTLSENTFKGLENLRELDLGGMSGEEFDFKVLLTMTKLKRLKLMMMNSIFTLFKSQLGKYDIDVIDDENYD